MRDGVSAEVAAGSRQWSQARAHSARIQDYLLGGNSNYLVDRAAAADVAGRFPAVGLALQANRAYMRRAAGLLARRGVRQFIDVGTGIPDAPHLHEVVQAVVPDATVVYVDNDPVVLVYADELERGTPGGTTRCVEADIRRPRELINAVRGEGCIAFDEPVALFLHAVLEFCPDDTRPHDIVGQMLDALPPGSYLSLTHCTADLAPQVWEGVVDAYARHCVPLQPRSRAEVLSFFGGLQLLDPGLAVAHRWRPDSTSGPAAADEQVAFYAGVGRRLPV